MEIQVTKLYDRGLAPDRIASVMGIDIIVVNGILGIVKEVVEETNEIIGTDDQLALEVLRQVAKDKRAHASARVQAATLLLDENKGRRNIAAQITAINGAAELNNALKSLRERATNAYKVIDVKNEPTTGNPGS